MNLAPWLTAVALSTGEYVEADNFAPLPAETKSFEELCPRFAGKVPIEVRSSDSPVVRLRKARLKELCEAVTLNMELIAAGNENPQTYANLIQLLRDTTNAAFPLHTSADSLRWCEEAVRLHRLIEQKIAVRLENGTVSRRDLIGFYPMRIHFALWYKRTLVEHVKRSM